MTHWRRMQDRNFLGAWSLEKDGKPIDVIFEIDHVDGAVVANAEDTTGKRCPILYFTNAKKPLVLNNTNGKTIESMYGPHIEEWRGKRVTLYATTTRVGKDPSVPCVRVRSKPPAKDAPLGAVPNEGDAPATRQHQKDAMAKSEAQRGAQEEPGSNG